MRDVKLKLKGEIILRKEEETGFGLLFDKNTQKVYELNSTAFFILELLSKQNCISTEDIEKELSTAFKVPKNIIEKDVENFILLLETFHLIERC